MNDIDQMCHDALVNLHRSSGQTLRRLREKLLKKPPTARPHDLVDVAMYPDPQTVADKANT